MNIWGWIGDRSDERSDSKAQGTTSQRHDVAQGGHVPFGLPTCLDRRRAVEFSSTDLKAVEPSPCVFQPISEFVRFLQVLQLFSASSWTSDPVVFGVACPRPPKGGRSLARSRMNTTETILRGLIWYLTCNHNCNHHKYGHNPGLAYL